MSPSSTFTSCGSSSSDVDRRILPTGVIRESLAAPQYPSPWCSVPTRIVRNLRIVNSRPSLPTRAWRNSTGRPSVAATTAAMPASSGAATGAATTIAARSRSRLPCRS